MDRLSCFWTFNQQVVAPLLLLLRVAQFCGYFWHFTPCYWFIDKCSADKSWLSRSTLSNKAREMRCVQEQALNQHLHISSTSDYVKVTPQYKTHSQFWLLLSLKVYSWGSFSLDPRWRTEWIHDFSSYSEIRFQINFIQKNRLNSEHKMLKSTQSSKFWTSL